ncbi:glycosyltransferase [Vibrio coralliilyticus]|uniref:glycosyltransferase family 4 protein n=1 Tax=Vibrio TaxID=662 RepID=UPI00068CCF0B|nr:MULTISPECIES: glycosyltransferase [Vibrio]NOI19532.1 glycosyltransferase [Vibrio coralliilyticus]
MKVLFFTNHYLPGYKAGGPIKSISNLCDELKDKVNINVVTTNHDFNDSKPYSNVSFDEPVYLNGYNVTYMSKVTLLRVKKQIEKISPDSIYLNSFFSKFTRLVLTLSYLGLINCKIILAPRGELSQGALSIKSRKKNTYIVFARFIKIINERVIFHATEENERKEINQRFDNEVFVLPNISSSLLPINKKNKVKGKLKIVFLSRISEKKNLNFALEVLNKLDSIDNDEVGFDIFGTQEDMSYWAVCESLMKKFKHIKVNYKGTVQPSEVHKTLESYHAFFLPTLGENYGHAIVEAMQAGVVPLISDKTPWNEIEELGIGRAINLNNTEEFKREIFRLTMMDNETFHECSNNVRDYISNKLADSDIVNKYYSIFSSN